MTFLYSVNFYVFHVNNICRKMCGVIQQIEELRSENIHCLLKQKVMACKTLSWYKYNEIFRFIWKRSKMSKLHSGLLQGLIQGNTKKQSNHCLENSAGNAEALSTHCFAKKLSNCNYNSPQHSGNYGKAIPLTTLPAVPT